MWFYHHNHHALFNSTFNSIWLYFPTLSFQFPFIFFFLFLFPFSSIFQFPSVSIILNSLNNWIWLYFYFTLNLISFYLDLWNQSLQSLICFDLHSLIHHITIMFTILFHSHIFSLFYVLYSSVVDIDIDSNYSYSILLDWIVCFHFHFHFDSIIINSLYHSLSINHRFNWISIQSYHLIWRKGWLIQISLNLIESIHSSVSTLHSYQIDLFS